MKLLINASNLHVGGGVQVATSFISELHDLGFFDCSIICSRKVYDSLPKHLVLESFSKFIVLDVFGFNKQSTLKSSYFNGYDVCFTIFGPFYPRINVKYHISGFAQPWIAYPKNIVYKKISFLSRVRNRVKFSIQSFFFKKYDHLIVEQYHIKNNLCSLGYSEDKISVVSNCVSSIFNDKRKWEKLNFDFEKLSGNITLGFVGRPYLHKNLNILKNVNDVLINEFGVLCNFIFTFTESEMEDCGFSKIKNFFSVGSIKATQCPYFYENIDALIFPSLLECFSASPIEAMAMDTTVLASDYTFVKEVCGDAAFYFDPLNSLSIAKTIYHTFSNEDLRHEKIKQGRNVVKKIPTARDRAISYLKIIENYNN